MHILSLECIAKLVAVFFAFRSDLISEDVCFVEIPVTFRDGNLSLKLTLSKL